MLVGVLVASSVAMSGSVQAAGVKMNKKTASVTEGAKVKLKVTGAKKKVKWTSSKSSVAMVKSTGKATATVTTKKAGITTITAKDGSKKCTCKITVKAKKAPVTTADQYKKLKNIIETKGTKDAEGNSVYNDKINISKSNIDVSFSYKPAEAKYYFDMTVTNTKTMFVRLVVKDGSFDTGDLYFTSEGQEAQVIGVKLADIEKDKCDKLSWNAADENIKLTATLGTELALSAWDYSFLSADADLSLIELGIGK